MTPLLSGGQQFVEDFFFGEMVKEGLLKDMVKYVKGGEKAESKCDSCNEESISVAAYCQQCGGLICEYCLQAHGKMKAFKHHNSTLLSELACGNVTINTVSKSPTCPNHPLMEITYYCSDCKMSVCQTGNHMNHMKHDVEFMGDLRLGILEKFNDVKKVTDHWEKKYQEHFHEAKSLPAALDRELRNAIGKVHEMAARKLEDDSGDDITATYSEGVRMEEKSLILEITDQKKVLISRIARVKAYIQRTLQQISEAKRFADFLSDRTSHWSTFTVVPQIHELFTTLNEEIIGGTPGLKNYGKMNFDFEEMKDKSTISFAKIIPFKFWGLKQGWNIKKISSKAWILTGLETLTCGQLLITGNRGTDSLIGRFDTVRGNFDFNTNLCVSRINCATIAARPNVGNEPHRTEELTAIGTGKKVLITSCTGNEIKEEYECWSETMKVSCISTNPKTQDVVVGNDCNSQLRIFDHNYRLQKIVSPRQTSLPACSITVNGDRILVSDNDGARAINLEGECSCRYLPTNESKDFINRAKVIRTGSHGNVFVLWERESEGGAVRKYFVKYREDGTILSEREVRENTSFLAVLPSNETDMVAVGSSRGWLGIYVYDFLK